MIKQNEKYAFAVGYHDGLESGFENNPYDNEKQTILYKAYREGYDRGVSDYCLENHPEEVNT